MFTTIKLIADKLITAILVVIDFAMRVLFLANCLK